MVIFSLVVLHCGKTYRGWKTLKALYLVVLTVDLHVPLILLEELGFEQEWCIWVDPLHVV